MECLVKDGILEFHLDTLKEVRKSVELHRPGDMKRAVDILEEWVNQQKHFIKKNFDRDYLERTILGCKGSIERAKSKLDKICTLRTLMPQYFGDYDLRTEFPELGDCVKLAILPKLTTDNYRLVVIKQLGGNCRSTFLQSFFRSVFVVTEYMKAHDYCQGYILFVDYSELNIADLLKVMYITEVRQGGGIIVEGYESRLKGLHIWTTSKLIDIMVSIIKQVVSTKLVERIQTHKNLESVYKFIPKDMLPIEYGGKEKSLTTLTNELLDAVSSIQHRIYQREMNDAGIDESLRQTNTCSDSFVSMPGTFRKLCVD